MLGKGPPPERALVGLATLSLLTGRSPSSSVIYWIDDVQWLDHESFAALTFAARRLQQDRVAMIFASRDETERLADLRDFDALELKGLAGPDAVELLGSTAGRLVDRTVAEQLIAACEGNPLAIEDLSTELSSAELAGGRLLLNRYR